MTNSRAKGKTGEREAANFLTSRGFPARRGQQYCAANGDADVVCDVLPGVHIEVKRRERGNLYAWLDQARRDAAAGKTPVVMHRRNASRWVMILDAEDLLEIIRRSDLLEPAGGWDSFAVVQRARDQADNVRQALLHDLLSQYANDMRHPHLTADQRARRIAAIEAALAPSISLNPATPETPPCPNPSN